MFLERFNEAQDLFLASSNPIAALEVSCIAEFTVVHGALVYGQVTMAMHGCTLYTIHMYACNCLSLTRVGDSLGMRLNGDLECC